MRGRRLREKSNMKILTKWREIIVEKMMLTIWNVSGVILFTNLSRFSKEWVKTFIVKMTGKVRKTSPRENQI